MTDVLEALRRHVHFLHESDGVRHVRLSLAARKGLATLGAPSTGTPQSPGSRTVATTTPIVTETRTPISRSQPLEISTPDVATSRPAPFVPASGTGVSLDLPPLEISGRSKAEQLQHLAERASVCVKCPHLAARRNTVVFGVGSPDARLMFIGEGPGEDEDLQGEPFVGRAGQLLTKMITAMGLTRAEVYIANVVKCRPDMPPGSTGNRKPTRQEMETCLPYLRSQIEVIRPGAIVALGATAVEGVLGAAGTIGSLRGKFLEYRGIPFMPTYHPSYLLRAQSNTEKRKVWEDLLLVMQRLEMAITEKQRGFFLAK